MTSIFRSLLLLGAAVTLPLPLAAQDVPETQEVIGFQVGSDRKLANYEESVRYFQALAKASDRIKLFEAGRTTQGRSFTYAVISSPENVRNFERYAEASRRLADPRGLSEAEARELARTSKIIVHIDGGMHAGEVADHQLPLVLAHKMLAAQDDAEVDAILQDVILVLWPSLNPDGQDMVVDWYRKQVGTPYETSTMPWLYQEYVGHDNNRDGYMLNMIESRSVNAIAQTYSPVIWYSQHQEAPFPARIWMPPFADPVSSNISPYMRIWTNAIGTNMMARFQAEQKPGAIAQQRFDNWYPGFLDYIHVFRNTISYFTEVAHRSATPRTYSVSDFPEQMQDLRPTIMYPDPWKGGEWKLADSVDYMLTASMSTLETAQKYRETLLFNRYQAGRDMMARYAAKGPSAYIIPAVQADVPEAASLAQLMIDHGLDVYQLTQKTRLGGADYAAGSWVIRTDQPFAGLATELLEPQSYPDAILNGEGSPAMLPYDVTGWTLPLQMGVKVDRIGEALGEEALAAMVPVKQATPPAGTVTGEGAVFLLPRTMNGSYRALNAALAAGAQARAVEARLAGEGARRDAIAITGLAREAMERIAAENAVPVTAVAETPAGTPLAAGKVGLYRPWGSNIDEGWTRWLFEQYAFPAQSLYNQDFTAEELAGYDVIVLPEITGGGRRGPATLDPEPTGPASKYKGSLASLMDGLRPGTVPDQYSGGIGIGGAEALRGFVRNGGTLVVLNRSADAIIELFDLPVENVLKDMDSETFFCSGALLSVKLNKDAAAAAGMPDATAVMFEHGPAFAMKDGFKGQVLASYSETENPLLSGVLIGPQAIQGKAAAVEVEYGAGRIVLYGFRPQWRGQSHGTYKMLFNPLYRSAASGATRTH
ncbi:conserved hypothetical protein [Altererythrobacter sp. B11]|uniref:M14 family metallopeptidase n=1 Tax=Altererythrobacter sp. B11 TaxID=2060312 RepID=UPI000DC6FDE6|nr:M14 metallopeptidase family protein [Altererythrobacter sp. B11]BBC73387.1 conserved hypothetical protein [Altererythrobacter sp. B11]